MVATFGGSLHIALGLAITHLVDGYADVFYDSFGITAIICGVIINILIAGIFIYLGIMANKHKKWSFIIGMILYGIDATILILYKNFYGLAFHLFALNFIFGGLKALSKYNEQNMD